MREQESNSDMQMTDNAMLQNSVSNTTNVSTGSSQGDLGQVMRLSKKAKERRLRHKEKRARLEVEKQQLERERLHLQRTRTQIEEDRQVGQEVKTKEQSLAIDEAEFAVKMECLNLEERKLMIQQQLSEQRRQYEDIVELRADISTRNQELSGRQLVEHFPFEHALRSIFLFGYLSAEKSRPEGCIPFYSDRENENSFFYVSFLPFLFSGIIFMISLATMLTFVRIPVFMYHLCTAISSFFIATTLGKGHRVIFTKGVYGTGKYVFFSGYMLIAFFCCAMEIFDAIRNP